MRHVHRAKSRVARPAPDRAYWRYPIGRNHVGGPRDVTRSGDDVARSDDADQAKFARRSAFVDGTSVAKDYGVLVINNARGTVAMNCSKLGLYGGIAMASLLALAPLGCENPSTGSGVAPDGGGVFQPDGGGANVVDPPVASECVPPTKGPTMHQGGSSSDPDNDVWTADGSPHILPYDTTIYKTVTIEPCAEVLLAATRAITVRGKLIAEGTATKRIHIGAKDAAQPWSNIRTSNGTVRLAYTTVDGGGDPLNTNVDIAGMLMMTGTDGTMPTQETLFVDHVTLSGSKSNGAVLSAGAGFAQGSQNLVIQGSTSNPINIAARAAGTLPAGSYTGNGVDAIVLPGGVFVESATLKNLGVPYNIGTPSGAAGDLRVEGPTGGPVSTLTIEPGVKLRFKKAGAFYVSFAPGNTPATAALIAVGGPAEKQIVFTSWETSPAAGDWLGISFGLIPLATNKLDNVRVEYAGGLSGTENASCRMSGEDAANNAGIRIFGPPPSQFITNTTIANSASYGIERAWRADNVTDFLPTNTFDQVAKCNETFPKDMNGACPTSWPCAK